MPVQKMNRSMDNLEMLSDSELRHRLMQYGFPNLPVTDTTRKTLIKKLRNHMANEKSKLKRETTYATRYSSDEESSDLDSKRRQGRGNFPLQGLTTRTTTYNTSSGVTNNNNNNTSMPPPSSTIVSRRVTSINSPVRSSYTDNRTSLPSVEKLPKRSAVYISPLIVSDSDEDGDYFNYKTKSSTNSRYSNSPTTAKTTPVGVYNFTPDQSPTDSWLRSRYFSTGSPQAYSSSPKLQQPKVDSTPPKTNGHSNDDTPYLSEFTRRLLNLRGETIRNDSNYRQSHSATTLPSRYTNSSPGILRPTDIVHQQSEPSTEWNISPSAAFSNLISRLDEQYGFKQTLIPCVLLSLLIVFFALVAFMYMTISPDLANTISEKSTIYRLCSQGAVLSHTDATSLNCLDTESVKDAVELLKVMAPELQKRIEHHKCRDSTASFMLSPKEVLLLERGQTHNVRKFLKDLHNVEYLIGQNPQWKIDFVDSQGSPLTFNQVVQLRDSQVYNFAILNPRLPFTCSLYNKLQKFFFFVGGLGVAVAGLLAIHIIYRWLINYQQSKRDAVQHLTDEIINALVRKASSDLDRSPVAVNHLRDKLIPLHKRRSLEWAWNEAIRNLEQNESRIQFELGIRNGEDCKLIRWIDTASPTEQFGPHRSPVKKWHSPAFDKTNKIACPPTECLKIRQMFDKYEANNPNLKVIIQDAILEKVGPQCRIYDIQLDKTSCCVYVRCATCEDAGIVHDEINGWWFDKRLVSIKFLRLERYLSRFPKSSSGPTCLQPSNTKNLSMSQCHRDTGALNGFADDDDDDDMGE